MTYVKKVLQEAVSSDPQTMAICKHVPWTRKSRFWCLGGCAGQQTTHVKMGHQTPIFEACIHLVISMAGSTGGQRFTVPGGLATEFFKEQLGPELLTVQEPPRGVKGDDG